MLVFDRTAVRRHRDRAAPTAPDHAFLFDHVADLLVERLSDIAREFPLALDLGCRDGAIGRALDRAGGRRVERLLQADLSPAYAAAAARPDAPAFACDEEALPVAEGRLDLVLSSLSLHWVNDLPGALLQIRRALRPDGLFLGAMFGAGTLRELRGALVAVEERHRGGASQRLSPFADLRDAAGLLQRAGFALPVADGEAVTVDYASPFRLLADLRGMGETNAVRGRDPWVPPRAFWPEVAAEYLARHGDAEGRVPATFEIIFLAGWAPHESQQRPLRPGSAARRFAEALGTVEQPAGDPAAPGQPSVPEPG